MSTLLPNHATKAVRAGTVVLVLALSACATSPSMPPEVAPPVTVDIGDAPPPDTTPEPDQRPAAEQPIPLSAWEHLSLASVARTPEREAHVLDAASALLADEQTATAEFLLRELAAELLTPTLRARRQLLRARIAQRAGRHHEAVRLLTEQTVKGSQDPAILAEFSWSLAESQIALERYADAARTLAARDNLLITEAQLFENDQLLWNVLETMDPVALRTERYTTADPLLAGWLDLAMISVETGSDPYQLRMALDDWALRYPQHPALGTVTRVLPSAPATSALTPRRIALLLPLTSVYGAAAQALQTGFFAAHDANSDPRKPEIAVYDIGAEPAMAPLYYRVAVDEGAEFVVGPLGRQAVDALTAEGDLLRPTLLLGMSESPTTQPTHVFEFGLQPEDEARQVAMRAHRQHHRVAAIAYPASDWGERVRGAFSSAWQQLGGIVAEAQPYAPQQIDYSIPLKRLLNVDESELRGARLDAALGQSIEFEPRRRTDIDFLFIAANSRDGRLLKPQINFFRAHDLPVYATSHIWPGRRDPANDADLDGVRFGDMPWMLDQGSRVRALRALQGQWAGRYSELDRLYALGLDAYSVLPLLDTLRDNAQARFNGVTATLRVSGTRLQRELTWARFEQGVALPASPLRSYDTTWSSAYDDSDAWRTSATRPVGGAESL